MSVKPEIIFVNDAAWVNGGAAFVALMEANALINRGYQVSFFCCAPSSPEQVRVLHPDIRLISTGQIDILRAPRLQGMVQGIHNFKAIAQLDALLATKDPNHCIIHLHSWNKALSPGIVSPMLQHGFPLICTLHEYSAACPNGTFYNHQKDVICRLWPMSSQCISSHCDSRSYPHKLWRTARHFIQTQWHGFPAKLTRFLVPSAYALNILKPYMPAGCVMNVLPNAVEVDKLPPAPVTDNQEIYYIGRLSAEKGVEVFLEAAQRIGLSPTVLGDGPSADQLRARFPEARYLGWAAPADVQRHLRRARALVFPSLWHENDPLIIKEAAAAGIPAIVSDQCAAADAIFNEQTGLHFRTGDVAGLEQALRRLANDAELAARLGQQAYEHFWRNPFTVDRHMDELEVHYRAMLNQEQKIIDVV